MPTSVQAYARIAGVLFLLSFIAGGFGESYVPSRLIVSADANATAHNIVALGSLFRMGFAGYLVEAVCDIALTLIFRDPSLETGTLLTFPYQNHLPMSRIRSQ
jgi:hypothetical protein